MDVAKSLRIEVIARNTFQDTFVETERTAWRIDMGRTNSQASLRYDELIAKQATKTKEQATTAKELSLELNIAT